MSAKSVKQLEAQVDERLDAIEEAVSEQSEALEKKLDAILAQMSKAINNPVVKNEKGFEPLEMEESVSEGMAEFADGRSMDLVNTTYDGEPLDFGRIRNDKEAMIKFMAEPVTIVMHETSDRDGDTNFFVGVNGFKKVFFRDGVTEYTVPRYIVEGLARARPVHYDNQEFTKSDGERATRWPSRRGVRYPFRVVTDMNPSGADWLAAIFREA